MILKLVEFVHNVQLPGATPGDIRWNTTLVSELYELTKSGDVVHAMERSTGKRLSYPWQSVRFAEFGDEATEPADPANRETAR